MIGHLVVDMGPSTSSDLSSIDSQVKQLRMSLQKHDALPAGSLGEIYLNGITFQWNSHVGMVLDKVCKYCKMWCDEDGCDELVSSAIRRIGDLRLLHQPNRAILKKLRDNTKNLSLSDTSVYTLKKGSEQKVKFSLFLFQNVCNNL